MIEISESNKADCCGCTACANICPKNAITMKEDIEGFLYPTADKEKCINCDLCKKVCPILNKKTQNENLKEAYVIRVKDENVLQTSTSGGFFTPLATEVLNKNGIIIGVGYGEDWKVEHLIVTKENENILGQLRGSKYVQSYLGNIFSKIKNWLNENETVLFSGTPCQVYGLLNFLGKDYKNLITIDFVCHGVPSPKLWKKYVNYQEEKHKSKIKKVYFRNKTYGYHSGTMKIVFANNKEYYGSARVDYMLKSFFSEISSRPSCYKCKFKDKNHISDFTIFDCWSASELVKDLNDDDDKGYTNLFVNTKKGEEILNNLKSEYVMYPVDIDKAIKLDGPMVEKSAVPHKNRKEFYKSLEREGLEKTISTYINVSLKDKSIEAMKKIMYKMNLLNKIKGLRK